MNGLVCRLEAASFAEPPADSQADQVGFPAVECRRFLQVAVEDFGFKFLVLVHQRVLPREGELPLPEGVGGSQCGFHSVVSLGFSFQKPPSVVGIGQQGKILPVYSYIAGAEIGGIAVGIVVPEIEATEESAVCRDGKPVRNHPVVDISHCLKRINLFLVVL